MMGSLVASINIYNYAYIAMITYKLERIWWERVPHITRAYKLILVQTGRSVCELTIHAINRIIAAETTLNTGGGCRVRLGNQSGS